MLDGCRLTRNLARKGMSDLLLAAHFFEPDDKYRAFQATAVAMGLIDDAAGIPSDDYEPPPARKREILAELDHFTRMIREKRIDRSVPFAEDLRLALVRFEIPDWPFISLAEAMRIDLDNERFDTLGRLLGHFAEDTAGPEAVFWHLAGCSFDNRGQLVLPEFDVREAAAPLAVFSRLVNILRDFKPDFLCRPRPMVYIDLETSDMFFVREDEMAEAVITGRQSLKFTKMIKWYFNRITHFQKQAQDALDHLSGNLPPDGRMAANLVYELTSTVARKISAHGYVLVRENLNLTRPEIESAARLSATLSGQSEKTTLERLRLSIRFNRAG